MTKNLEELYNIMNRFKPYIENPKEVYTFIGPKNSIEYDSFIEQIYRISGNSLSNILRNKQELEKILMKYFSDSELEIYIISEDKKTQFIQNGKLKNYIKEKKISFVI